MGSRLLGALSFSNGLLIPQKSSNIFASVSDRYYAEATNTASMINGGQEQYWSRILYFSDLIILLEKNVIRENLKLKSEKLIWQIDAVALSASAALVR